MSNQVLALALLLCLVQRSHGLIIKEILHALGDDDTDDYDDYGYDDEDEDLFSVLAKFEDSQHKSPYNADKLNQIQVRINDCIARLPGDDAIAKCRKEGVIRIMLDQGFNHTGIGDTLADCLLDIDNSNLSKEELRKSAACSRKSFLKPLI